MSLQTSGPLELYWFCLRRNKRYRAEIRHFKRDLQVLAQHYCEGLLVSDLSKEARLKVESGQLLKLAPGEIPVPDWSQGGRSPIEPFQSHDIESIDALNQWYIEFVNCWRILPRDYNETSYPSRLAPAIPPVRDFEVVRQPGDFSFFGNVINTPKDVLLKKFCEAMEFAKAKAIGQPFVPQPTTTTRNSLAGAQPKKRRGTDLPDLSEIQVLLELFRLWESYHGWSLCLVPSPDLAPSTLIELEGHTRSENREKIWPQDICASLGISTTTSYGTKEPHEISSLLTKKFKRATYYIYYPQEILRLAFRLDDSQ